MRRITATEAGMHFPALLNRAASGEEIEVTRDGEPVAVIGPPRSCLLSAARFREVLASAPRADEEFRDDVRALRETVSPPAEP